MIRTSALTVALAWSASAAFAAAPSPRETLEDAKQVLDDLTDKEKAIPAKLLQDAEAVLIVPKTIKAGLGVGGQLGHGVVVVKDKAGGWGDIRFIDLGGASVGFQIGVQSTDVVLVFKNRKGLDRLLDGKAKLKLGADASVAAGPVGRDAAIATDLLLKSEIVSYSRAKGLFAGVALEGVVLSANGKRTEDFEKDAGEKTKAAGDELKKTLAILAAAPLPKKDRDPAFAPAPLPIPMVMPQPGAPGLDPVPPASVPTAPGAVVVPAAQPVIVPAEAVEPPTGPIRRLLKRIKW